MKLFLKSLVFTLCVPGVVGGCVPWFAVRSRDAATGWPFTFGLALLGFGAAVYLWCAFDFALFGRGTPAPIDAPKRLVVRGLYRFSRNPMYVGVTAAIVGWSLLYSARPVLIYGACVAAGFQLWVKFYEEPHLTRVFGAEYSEYCARVGRWLTLPGRLR